MPSRTEGSALHAKQQSGSDLPSEAPELRSDMQSERSSGAKTESSDTEAAADVTRRHGPLVLIVTGMAGSGKSTLVKAMDTQLRSEGKRVYIVNLDPAVSLLPFSPNVDIRDSVEYKRVMQHYKLGPNGAIMTALNLFATKFGSLLHLLQQRSSSTDVVLIDTPGQIEVFTWSASGALMTEALATTFPTALVYAVDACRSKSPNTLLSNMVHACSVLYRHKLPFLAAFTKVDAEDPALPLQWMMDYDAFQEALLADDRYMGSLGRSTALALCGFYETIETICVSSVTLQVRHVTYSRERGEGRQGPRGGALLSDNCECSSSSNYPTAWRGVQRRTVATGTFACRHTFRA
ncbi:XPA-binding protein [Cyclospora cayetanensis]|uniref:GPN-loop GTPase n=1 Tax=Cyclospora cayetanensis TaxID=88456 RepID=A0A1D3D1I3_9EIME|nr:XPA-binding protein [Cyclospora cayetanensis]